MAITGIDTLDGKQIIAAGASSAVKAAQDGNGNIITATYQPTAGMSNYQTTAGMSNYQTTAGMSNYATTASVTGKQDALTFGYTDNQISQINGSGIYSQGGGASYTGNVQEALDKVYTDSASWDNVSAKQDKLTFNYDGSNNITGINSSAIGGGGTQVVTSIKTKSYYGRTVITGVNDAESMITAYGREYAVDTNSYYFTSFNGSGISAGRAYGYINGSNSFVPFYQVGSSAMSGCAASAYIKNNVTGNITNWNAVTTIVSSNSADWNNVSAKEDKLTFAYDASDNITAINSSAIAGGSTPVVTATYRCSGKS